MKCYACGENYTKNSNEMQRLKNRILELEIALKDAHENIGFLSMHLHGRMGEEALFNMAKKADKWKALVEHKK